MTIFEDPWYEDDSGEKKRLLTGKRMLWKPRDGMGMLPAFLIATDSVSSDEQRYKDYMNFWTGKGYSAEYLANHMETITNPFVPDMRFGGLVRKDAADQHLSLITDDDENFHIKEMGIIEHAVKGPMEKAEKDEDGYNFLHSDGKRMAEEIKTALADLGFYEWIPPDDLDGEVYPGLIRWEVKHLTESGEDTGVTSWYTNVVSVEPGNGVDAPALLYRVEFSTGKNGYHSKITFWTTNNQRADILGLGEPIPDDMHPSPGDQHAEIPGPEEPVDIYGDNMTDGTTERPFALAADSDGDSPFLMAERLLYDHGLSVLGEFFYRVNGRYVNTGNLILDSESVNMFPHVRGVQGPFVYGVGKNVERFSPNAIVHEEKEDPNDSDVTIVTYDWHESQAIHASVDADAMRETIKENLDKNSGSMSKTQKDKQQKAYDDLEQLAGRTFHACWGKPIAISKDPIKRTQKYKKMAPHVDDVMTREIGKTNDGEVVNFKYYNRKANQLIDKYPKQRYLALVTLANAYESDMAFDRYTSVIFRNKESLSDTGEYSTDLVPMSSGGSIIEKAAVTKAIAGGAAVEIAIDDETPREPSTEDLTDIEDAIGTTPQRLRDSYNENQELFDDRHALSFKKQSDSYRRPNWYRGNDEQDAAKICAYAVNKNMGTVSSLVRQTFV